MKADKEGVIRVLNSEQRPCPDEKGKWLPRNAADGEARIMDPSKKEGALGVSFSVWQPFWANYNVLDTDYDNYAVVYSCTSILFGLYKSEFAWVLMRQPHLKDSEEFRNVEEIGKRVLTREVPGYDPSFLRKTLHGKDADCIY
mmetsp:Transcript_1437/g.2514  ORF Transcript_1437/g.2514 Transcript_1437/m.2514 type:complete len:143 (-) Transcript_1437:43-471(-)|eukprot:CAMPEP_0168617150 /NCGR_PEP_ID=MMETSP0449_2-20121227/5396_1 /TAXON_ID=1082188 /ORGANISM="Strombidium rassoulzadegani, Strain ras09" /LENGTH=142 /DNA_ID=CAMNT_0008657961 /DNA_START=477 /DNA_END=905 /DNA_ORIENTATION=+